MVQKNLKFPMLRVSWFLVKQLKPSISSHVAAVACNTASDATSIDVDDTGGLAEK